MSMMICHGCDQYIDTDDQPDCQWEPVFRCETCAEDLPDASTLERFEKFMEQQGVQP